MSTGPSPDTASDRPNVLQIFVDDLGWTDVAAANPDTIDRLLGRLRTWEADVGVTDGWTTTASAPPLTE